MLRSPERHEHPSGSLRVFVGGYRAVDAGRLIILIFVTDEFRTMLSCRVVFSAERARVEEPGSAFLAGLHEPLTARVVEHRPGHLQIHVALQKVFSVRRTEVVLRSEEHTSELQ